METGRIVRSGPACNSLTILKFVAPISDSRTTPNVTSRLAPGAYSAAGKATQLLSFYLNFVSDKATDSLRL